MGNTFFSKQLTTSVGWSLRNSLSFFGCVFSCPSSWEFPWGFLWWFPKMVGFPNKPMGFPTKNDHFGVFGVPLYHHFKKPPYKGPVFSLDPFCLTPRILRWTSYTLQSKEMWTVFGFLYDGCLASANGIRRLYEIHVSRVCRSLMISERTSGRYFWVAFSEFVAEDALHRWKGADRFD